MERGFGALIALRQQRLPPGLPVGRSLGHLGFVALLVAPDGRLAEGRPVLLHCCISMDRLLGERIVAGATRSPGSGMAEANTPSGSKRHFNALSRAPLLP